MDGGLPEHLSPEAAPLEGHLWPLSGGDKPVMSVSSEQTSSGVKQQEGSATRIVGIPLYCLRSGGGRS